MAASSCTAMGDCINPVLAVFFCFDLPEGVGTFFRKCEDAERPRENIACMSVKLGGQSASIVNICMYIDYSSTKSEICSSESNHLVLFCDELCGWTHVSGRVTKT